MRASKIWKADISPFVFSLQPHPLVPQKLEDFPNCKQAAMDIGHHSTELHFTHNLKLTFFKKKKVINKQLHGQFYIHNIYVLFWQKCKHDVMFNSDEFYAQWKYLCVFLKKVNFISVSTALTLSVSW